MIAERLGTVVEVTTPYRVEFVAAEGVFPMIGDYVSVALGEGRWVLGMITHVERGSRELTGRDIVSADDADKIIRLVGEPREWSRATVKLLGVVEEGGGGIRLSLPRVPPPSGAGVFRAPREALRSLFVPDHGRGVEIGRLLTRDDVRVSLDPNELVSRHLAILAVTGAGKSNTVAVLVDRLLDLGGVVAIFDLHSEYGDLELTGSGEVLRVDPVINVNLLSLGEIAQLLGISYDTAPRQYIYLSRVWKGARKLRGEGRLAEVVADSGIDGANPDSVLDGMLSMLYGVAEAAAEGRRLASFPGVDVAVDRDAKSSVYGLIARMERIRDAYGRILVTQVADLADLIDYGRAVVVDLGSLGLDAADVLVGHSMMRLLSRARAAVAGGRDGGELPLPAMLFLEEAHLLVPRAGGTYTGFAASRIAREGRKFGVGLCLVSQRPKRLDQDVLSQMVNKVILRIVEPDDQSYVRRATEFLSEDLVSYLPSLNVGEAVVVGPMVRVPAMVRVDEFRGKRGGATPRAVDMWERGRSGGAGEGWPRRGYGSVVR